MTEEKTITLTVPESWNEISIGLYQELHAYSSSSGIMNRINAIACLTDSDPEVIKYMSGEDYKLLNDKLAWSSETPTSDFKHTINIDGIDYSLIPKFNEMTVGEWADIDTYSHEFMANLHKIFAVLYRPLISAVNDQTRFIEKYDTITAEERAKIFQDKMMIADVYGACLFFSKIGMLFTNNLLRFLEEMKNQTT